MHIKVLALIVATAFLATSGDCVERTIVAPGSSEEETTVQGLSAKGVCNQSGEKEEETSASGNCISAKASHVGSIFHTSPHTPKSSNDVVLHSLLHSEQSEDGYLSAMQSSLVQGLGSTQSSKIKEQECQAEEATAEGTREVFRCSTEAERTKLDGTSSKSPVGAIDTSNQEHDEGFRCFGWGNRAAVGSTSARVASTAQSPKRARGVDRGRKSASYSSERFSLLGCRDECSSSSRIGALDGQREGLGREQSTISWTHSQVAETGIASSEGSQQSENTGQRMEGVDPEDHGRNAAACYALPSMSSRKHGALQCQDSRAYESQAGAHTGVPILVEQNGRGSDCDRGHSQFGRPVGEPSEVVARNGSSLRHLGWRTGLGDGRGIQRCSSTGVRRKKGEACKQLQAGNLSQQSGYQPSQAKEGCLKKIADDGVESFNGDMKNFAWDHFPFIPQGERQKRKRVRFATRIEVIIWHKEESCEVNIPCVGLHGWLRTWWHMDGQMCSWDLISHAFSSVSLVPWLALTSHESEERQIAVANTFDRDDNVEFGMQSSFDGFNGEASNTGHGELESMLGLEDHQSRKFVETWFLRVHDYQCCMRSRRVKIETGMDVGLFHDLCRQTWIDVSSEEMFNFIIVSPKPPGLPSTCAHVILVQGDHEGHRPAILNTNILPPLRQNRAILYPEGATVRNVFQIAHIPEACERRNAWCQVEGFLGIEKLVLRDSEQVAFNEGAMISGMIMVVDDMSASEHASSDAESDDSSEGSTRYVTDLELEEDNDSQSEDDESTLMSVLDGQQMRQVMPYAHPWEWHQDGDHQMFEEEEHDDVLLPQQVWDQIQSHAQQQIVDVNDAAQRWLLITFGLGVADLGRRDVELHSMDLLDVQQEIRQLWADHVIYGDLEVQFVQPQPQLTARPSIVVIVVVRYDENIDDEWRSVLVQETSSEDYQPKQDPYAHFVASLASSRRVAMDLGMHECFPVGIRTCTVTMRGTPMDQRQQQDVPEGSLCEIHVGAIPRYAWDTRHMVPNGEQFFITLRTIYEARDNLDWIRIRAHGISPSNNPLGHRDVIIPVRKIVDVSWVQEVHSQWHFYEYEIPRMFYVAQINAEEQRDDDIPTFHFVLSYARSHSGVAILVRQRMLASNEQTAHRELWAIMIQDSREESEIFAQLWRTPFWFHPIARSSLTRRGVHLEEHDTAWSNGEMLDLSLVVPERADMLRVLLEIKNNDFDEKPVIDHVDLLQRFSVRFKSNDGFVDICSACLPDIEGDDDYHDLPMGDDGSHLQQTIDTDKGHTTSNDEDLGSLRNIVQQLLQDSWVGLNRDFTVLHPKYPAARMAIAQTVQWDEPSSRFHIYTDGSAKQGKAAWAFVVICEFQGLNGRQFARVGYSGAKLSDEDDKYRTSVDAEAAAIVHMCDYLLGRPMVAGMELHCYFDAKSIGMAAFGIQNTQEKGDCTSLVYQARIIMAMVQRKFACFPFHVHAHEGNPFNELTDGIAGFVRAGNPCPVQPQSRTEQLFSHKLCEWAWLEVAPSQELPDLRRVLANEQPWPDQYQVDPVLCIPGKKHEEEFADSLEFVTVNVGTLEYDGDSTSMPTSLKSRELALQFQEQGWAIICMQETRAKCACIVDEGPYTKIVSPGMQGQAGVEIWLHLEMLKEKLRCDFQIQKDVVVWFSDPRILAVHLGIPGQAVDIVCCYAPQRGRTQQEIQAWWQSLDNAMAQRTWTGPIWLAGDMNCSVGSLETAEVGDASPDLEDFPGECMRLFAQKWGLVVLNTWHDIHRGPAWTHQGIRGGFTRIDYILVSEECREAVESTHVDHEVDVLNGGKDHFPLVAKIHFTVGGDRQSLLRRTTRYNRNEARKMKQKGSDLLHTIPQIPWDSCQWTLEQNSRWTSTTSLQALSKAEKTTETIVLFA